MNQSAEFEGSRSMLIVAIGIDTSLDAIAFPSELFD
jgi:hypothetical protein